MELIYVFGVALGLALWVGLMVRKAIERKDAHDRAVAAFVADPDRGWPPMEREWPEPPPVRPT